ncbi:MAG: hypothetical protein AVDCRST_MAG13-1479, partial [uncultured Solirubrobacteraceae bacterium]
PREPAQGRGPRDRGGHDRPPVERGRRRGGGAHRRGRLAHARRPARGQPGAAAPPARRGRL